MGQVCSTSVATRGGWAGVRSGKRKRCPVEAGSRTRLVPEGEMLRVSALKTGKPVLTRQEQAERAKQQARNERRRAAELAAEVERLRQLLKEHDQPEA